MPELRHCSSGRNDAIAQTDHRAKHTGHFAAIFKFAGLETHEWADETTKEAVHAEFARHSHQAKAGLAVTHNRLMILCLITEIEISGAEPATFMAKAALEDASQFGAGMSM